MREVVLQIPTLEAEQNIDIDVKINGKRRTMHYRVEIVEWHEYEELKDDKVAVIRHVIKEHEADWQLIQIGMPTETHIPIMFRKKGMKYVEIKVYKCKNVMLISEYDLKKEINRQKYGNSNIFGIDASHINMQSLHVNIEDYSDFILVTRTKLRNEKTAINIAQKAIERDVFCKYLFIIEEEPNLIKTEVKVRSDDFTEGVLIEKFELKDNE